MGRHLENRPTSVPSGAGTAGYPVSGVNGADAGMQASPSPAVIFSGKVFGQKFMARFNEPGFNDRRTAAEQARAKALEKLKAKPAPDPAVLAERAAKAAEKEAALAAKREAAKAAREAQRAEREAKKREAAEAAAAEEARKTKPVLSDEEKKAIRDAKYAARKARKGKK